MEKKLTNLEIQEFLNDFEKNSETTILEEGSKEKNELEKIAEARGIKIKGSRDLAIFKTIYAFTDQPNSNGAILPKEELLRVLPQIVGKPININHERRFVVGHYIDYRYKQKNSQVNAYGIYYKSNFGKEFEEAKKLLKKKKLSSSFEIWSPKDKRKYKEDGSYEMYQMELAGGALIYEDKNNEPAFKDAKVLSIGKKSEVQNLELVYASKYKEDEIITCKNGKCELVKAQEKKVEKKLIIKGDLKKVELNNENKKIENQITKVKCSNCSEEFDYNGIDVQVKCPKCFAILNKEGTMQYPPQIKDFKLLCPSCRTGRWLILSRKEDTAKLRCSQCAKEYNVTFEKAKVNEAISKISFVYTSTISCPQCGKSIYIAGVSGMDSRTVKCGKCKLEFAYNVKDERYKRISKIEEVIPNKENKIDSKKESSEEGGQKMAKEKKIEKASEKKVEVKKDEFDGKSVEEIRQIIHDRLEKGKVKLKKEVKVKKEKLDKTKKDGTLLTEKEFIDLTTKTEVKKTPKTAEKVEEPKIKEKKVEVKKEKAKEKPEVKTKETPKAEIKAKEVPKAEEPKVKDKKAKATKKETPKEKVEVKIEKKEAKVTEIEKYPKSKYIRKVLKENKALLEKSIHNKELIKEAVKKLREQKKLTLAEKVKVKLYADNAKTIIERRTELGDTELTDEDILNDDKFEKAKLEKENLLLKANEEKTDELVGSKKKDKNYYTEKHKKIDKYAFGKVNKKHKK